MTDHQSPVCAHPQAHRLHRAGWLRAAVLGANDGIVSTASFIVGVHAAGGSHAQIVLSGVLTLIAGAVSMAAGEYVSVSSQSDIENADLELEKTSLAENAELEYQELVEIYRSRGLSDSLAREVARELMAVDPLKAHARDEIGIQDVSRARPFLAALASAFAFMLGAALPLLAASLSSLTYLPWVTGVASVVALIILGLWSAVLGGASKIRSMLRVAYWGVIAMVVTSGIGELLEALI